VQDIDIVSASYRSMWHRQCPHPISASSFELIAIHMWTKIILFLFKNTNTIQHFCVDVLTKYISRKSFMLRQREMKLNFSHGGRPRSRNSSDFKTVVNYGTMPMPLLFVCFEIFSIWNNTRILRTFEYLII